MSGGVGFDHLADVLPDPAGWVGVASDDVDEADHPVRVGGGGRAQRGPAGQGRRGEAVAHQPDPCDTTVVPANVAYPTDSGLLAKAVRRIAATSRRIQAAGGAVRTRVRDRSRAAGKRAHAVAAKLRSRAALGRDSERGRDNALFSSDTTDPRSIFRAHTTMLSPSPVCWPTPRQDRRPFAVALDLEDAAAQ